MANISLLLRSIINVKYENEKKKENISKFLILIIDFYIDKASEKKRSICHFK